MKLNINWLRKIKKKWDYIPDIPNSYVRSYLVLNYITPLGGLIHLGQIFAFHSLGAKIPSYANIGSSMIWLLLFLINRKGFVFTAFFIAGLEIIAHSFLCSLTIGPHVGYQYILFVIPIGSFLQPTGRILFKIFQAFLAIGSFTAIYYLTANIKPIYAISYNDAIATNIINLFFAGLFLVLLGYYYSKVASDAEEKLALEHAKAENLLQNILPKSIADRLKTENKTIADVFKETTILFADIVGFTSLSEKTDPDKLVALLNEIFSRFDDLVEKHQLEKIKTIGDAYMVAAGIPMANSDHAATVINFALDMKQELKQFNLAKNQDLRIRIGINSGPAIAGVIGKKKFIYDLWGDSVNIAARMESHGVPGEIQTTTATKKLVENQFVFKHRGKIQIKGKGMMDVYLVIGEKTDS